MVCVEAGAQLPVKQRLDWRESIGNSYRMGPVWGLKGIGRASGFSTGLSVSASVTCLHINRIVVLSKPRREYTVYVVAGLLLRKQGMMIHMYSSIYTRQQSCKGSFGRGCGVAAHIQRPEGTIPTSTEKIHACSLF